MKKPERMKNKTTKAFLYQNLYPVNLYVTTLDDWEDACDFFDFFLTTKELRNDEWEPRSWSERNILELLVY